MGAAYIRVNLTKPAIEDISGIEIDRIAGAMTTNSVLLRFRQFVLLALITDYVVWP